MHATRVTEGEETVSGDKEILKAIKAENFPKPMEDLKPQEESSESPRKVRTRKAHQTAGR